MLLPAQAPAKPFRAWPRPARDKLIVGGPAAIFDSLQAAGRTGVRGATCIITERDNLSYQGGDSTFIAYGVAFCVS